MKSQADSGCRRRDGRLAGEVGHRGGGQVILSVPSSCPAHASLVPCDNTGTESKRSKIANYLLSRPGKLGSSEVR